MIQIMEGPSGSGKSYQLYTRMIEQSMKDPERRFFLIVPEQFTMQAQRDVVMMHPKHGTMNIDIVSFNRLAYRVFEEQNIKCEHILEDFGKSMLLKRILLEHRKELPVFGPNVGRDGFIDELKSLFTELFQYRITAERLQEVLDHTTNTLEGHDMLRQKLRDLLFVYRRFREEVQDTYIIAEHILEMLAMYVPQSDLLADSVLFLDGYTGFTPIQYDLLEALASKVSSMTLTVTIDAHSVERESLAEHELFYLSKDTITRIQRLGEKMDIYVEEEFLSDGTPRFAGAPELNFLEQNLFRYPYRVWESVQDSESEHSDNLRRDGECKQLHIMAMKNTRQELQVVARQIHALVREGRYRYRDIAIIHGDLTELAPIAEEIMPEMGIPYFIDMNQSMYMNPCLESIRALLDIAEQDYSYDSVFRFLKTGVMGDGPETDQLQKSGGETEVSNGKMIETDIEFNNSGSMPDFDEIEALENYCRRKGIRGLNWWRRVFADDRLEELPEGHEENRIIKSGMRVLELLQTTTEMLRQAQTVQDYVQAVMDYLDQIQMQEFLNRKVLYFEEAEDYVQAKAYSQIYDKLMDILDKLSRILGTARMKIDEFHALLDTGLNDIALGVIPPSLDQLVIGDIERTRLNHIKVLYVMGINDGIIPKVSRGAGILSESDRSILSGEIELAPDSRSQVFTEQFYIYQNITKPSDALYLTYHTQDSEGNDLQPAYLIGRICKLFPCLEVEYPDVDVIGWNRIETEQDSRGLLAARLHEDGRQSLSEEEKGIWKSLYLYYQKESPEVLVSLQEGIHYNNIGQLLTPETAARLYGDFMNTSVSKLETYSRCPYQFFLEYGLNLRVREKNEVSLSDMGTLLHGVVEQVFRQVETRKAEEYSVTDPDTDNPWERMTDEELTALTMQAVDRLAQSEKGDVYRQTYANQHLLQRMKRTAAYAVVDLKEQLLKGKMIPYRFELAFNRRNAEPDCKDLTSAKILLENGATLQMGGIIDRIDVCQDDSHVYVKVLDYKSSQKELELTQVSAGLQLQLLIYTNVVMEVLKKQFPDKEIIPAGSLYYGFKLPMVEKRSKEETTQKNIAKATAMTGLVNEDEPCMTFMGNEDILPVYIEKEKKAVEAPASYKEDGMEDMPKTEGEQQTGQTQQSEREGRIQQNEQAGRIQQNEQTGQIQQNEQAGQDRHMNTERYLELLDEVRGTVKELGEEILSGEIPIRPVRSGRGLPCDYCDYRDVCKLDLKDGGNRVMQPEQLKNLRNRKQS